MERLEAGLMAPFDDRLHAVAAGCSWSGSAAALLDLVPELAGDLPPLDAIEVGGRPGPPRLPVTFAGELAVRVAGVVAQLGEAALSGAPREQWHDASPAEALADPLVPFLAELLVQSTAHGLALDALPAISLAWASSRALQGGWPLLRRVDSGLSARLDALRARLDEMAPADRGAAISAVVWGVQGRAAAAVFLAAASSQQAQACALHRAMLTSPLALAFPRGALDPEPNLALVAAVLRLPMDGALLEYVPRAVAAVLGGDVGELLAGRSVSHPTAAAVSLAALLRRRGLAEAEPAAVVMDPRASVELLAAMPDLIDGAALGQVGLPRDAVSGLLSSEGARALASSWQDLVIPLLRWDVMAAIGAAVLPVAEQDGAWAAAAGRVAGFERWRFRVPRVEPEVEGTVVAVRLSGLKQVFNETAARLSQPLLVHSADDFWRELAARHGAELVCAGDVRGLVVFESAVRAASFARGLLADLTGGAVVPLHRLEAEVRVPEGLDVSVGIATGPVSGGYDGRGVVLGGEVVARAVALSGLGPANWRSTDDVAGVRRAVVSGDGVRGSGIVCDADTAEAMVDALLARGGPVHTRSRGGVAAGLGTDFSHYPVRAWWEDDERIGLLLALPESPDLAFELVELDRDGLQAMFAADQRAAKGGAPEISASGDARHDPFAPRDWSESDDDRPTEDEAPVPVDTAARPAAAARPGSTAGGADLGMSMLMDSDSDSEGSASLDGADSQASAPAAPAAAPHPTERLRRPFYGENLDLDAIDRVLLESNRGSESRQNASLEDSIGLGPAPDFQRPPSIASRLGLSMSEDDRLGLYTDPSVDTAAGLAGFENPKLGESAGGRGLSVIGPPMLLEDVSGDGVHGHDLDSYGAPLSSDELSAPEDEGDLAGFGGEDGGGQRGGADEGPAISPPMLLDDAPDGVVPSVSRSSGDGAVPEGPEVQIEDDGGDVSLEPSSEPGAAGRAGRLQASGGFDFEVDAPDDFPDVGFANDPGPVRPSVDPQAGPPQDGGGASGGAATEGETFAFLDFDASGPEVSDAAPPQDGEWTAPAEESITAFVDDFVGAPAPDQEFGFQSIDSDADDLSDESFGFDPVLGEMALDRAPSAADAPPASGHATRDPSMSTGSVAEPSTAAKLDDPREGRADAAGTASPMKGAVPDLGGVFAGYREIAHGDGSITIGLRDGDVLRDAHTYKVAGDRAAAYVEFLSDKLAEGFVPRAELTRVVGHGRVGRALDEALLSKAYQNMVLR